MDEGWLFDESLTMHTLAERAVLGAAMLSRDVLQIVLRRLTEQDFSTGEHRCVFSTLLTLCMVETSTDAPTVLRMISNGDWDFSVSPDRLISQMISAAQERPDFKTDLTTVKNLAVIRRGLILKPNGIPVGRANDLSSTGFEFSADIQSIARVRATELQWLWPGRIPRGKVTVIAGDPGLGKSFLTVDITARVSMGREWPDNEAACEPGSVMMLNAEDDPADTLRPRLEAAGADCSRVFFVDSINDADRRVQVQRQRHFSLVTDIPYLRAWLKQNPDTRLITIDPISAFWISPEARYTFVTPWIMSELNRLAQQFQVAIVVVTHLRRSIGTKSLYRVLGDMSIVTTARAAWLVTRDLEDSTRRKLLPAKMNLREAVTGLAYRIEEGRVAWEEGAVEETADESLCEEYQAEKDSKSINGSRGEVMTWLRTVLANGPRPAREILDEAKELGHSERTMRRAFKRLNCRTEREPLSRVWTWSLGTSTIGEVPRG